MSRLTTKTRGKEEMKKLFLIPIVFGLAACATTDGPKVFVSPEMVDRPKITLPEVPPALQTNLEWHIITRDNVDQKLKEIEQKQGTVTLFALTSQGYQNLSMNVAELRRYIQQQNATIAALRQYYEAPVKKDDSNGK
jgi:uncharacterized lipoprotein YajG